MFWCIDIAAVGCSGAPQTQTPIPPIPGLSIFMELRCSPSLANGNQTEANLLIGDTFCPNRFETNRPALPSLHPPPSILYQCPHQIFSRCLQWEDLCGMWRPTIEEIKGKNRWHTKFFLHPPALCLIICCWFSQILNICRYRAILL